MPGSKSLQPQAKATALPLSLRYSLACVLSLVVFAAGFLCGGQLTPSFRVSNVNLGRRDAGAPAIVQPWCSSSSLGIDAAQFPQPFWFVKTFKTGGTTVSGVLRGLCAHYGILPVTLDPSHVHGPPRLELLDAAFAAAAKVSRRQMAIGIMNHMRYDSNVVPLFYKYTWLNETKQPLLLFTSVRHPVTRVYSMYVHELCLKAAWKVLGSGGTVERVNKQCGGVFGDDGNMVELALASDTLQQRWDFVKGQHLNTAKHNLNYDYTRGNATSVEQAAAQYKFIFVQERMDESLVVFMLEYGLTFADIAYVAAKNRTGRYKSEQDMPAELNNYIETMNAEELQLWTYANKLLDEKIVQLQQRCGNDIVASALQLFRHIQSVVANNCTDFKSWYDRHAYPGEPTSWYDDEGFAPRCVAYVVRRLMA